MTPRTSISRLADCAPIPRPESWAARKPPRVATARAYPLDQVAEVETMLGEPPRIEHAFPTLAKAGTRRCKSNGRDEKDLLEAGSVRLRREGTPQKPVLNPTYIDDTPVMRAAHAAIEAEARATARAALKMRAHLYALHPRELDAIEIGLASFRPHSLTSRLRQIARDPTLRRWYGFGGEVTAINLHGAMLYARYLRAKANQVARRAR